MLYLMKSIMYRLAKPKNAFARSQPKACCHYILVDWMCLQLKDCKESDELSFLHLKIDTSVLHNFVASGRVGYEYILERWHESILEILLWCTYINYGLSLPSKYAHVKSWKSKWISRIHSRHLSRMHWCPTAWGSKIP